jgi:hypothetical protein
MPNHLKNGLHPDPVNMADLGLECENELLSSDIPLVRIQLITDFRNALAVTRYKNYRDLVI